MQQETHFCKSVCNHLQQKSTFSGYVDVPQSTASKGGMVQFEYQRLRRTDGLEVQSVLELFYLRVPAGTRDGEVLDIEKMGHTGVNGGRSGDLHCTVNTIADPNVDDAPLKSPDSEQSTHRQPSDRPSSNDGTVKITFPEAVLGGRVTVNTPDGEVVISIPSGSSSGRRLRIRGKGLNGADYIVTLQIVIPTDLDGRSIELVREFAERNPLSPR